MGIQIDTKNGTIQFGVMTVPNRKQKALYISRGANIDVLAYFTSDENAERFDKALDMVIDEWDAAIQKLKLLGAGKRVW